MENYTSALPIGTRLQGTSGTFEIVDILGQGGFGITYKAELLMAGSLGLQRTHAYFAVKEFFMSKINRRSGLTVTGTESENFHIYLRKFEHESRLLAKLSHPGICHVQDAFSANGTAYYVMDFCSGGSLVSLIRNTRGGALSEIQALDYARQIGDALGYLHNHHMAHLDLKPDNVMLQADGSAVLIDFGIAKQFDGSGKLMTTDNIGASTPGYAPIEQSHYQEGSGDPHLMDIYAFGATLYKMLCGQTPPPSSEVCTERPLLEPLRARGVSERVISVIVKAMQTRKADRYQSTSAMLAALPSTAPTTESSTVVATVEDEPEVVSVSRPKPEKKRQIKSSKPASKPAPAPVVPKPAPEPVYHEEEREKDKVKKGFNLKEFARSNEKIITGSLLLSIILLCILILNQPDETSDEMVINHPATGDLCAVRNGEISYFNTTEWAGLSESEKSSYEKLGIYMSGDFGIAPFLVGLHLDGKQYTWEQAMIRFGDSLPTKAQGEIIAKEYKSINAALMTFGGGIGYMSFFWTRTEYNSDKAWFVPNSDSARYENKSHMYGAVTVSLTPEALAM